MGISSSESSSSSSSWPGGGPSGIMMSSSLSPPTLELDRPSMKGNVQTDLPPHRYLFRQVAKLSYSQATML